MKASDVAEKIQNYLQGIHLPKISPHAIDILIDAAGEALPDLAEYVMFQHITSHTSLFSPAQKAAIMGFLQRNHYLKGVK